MWPCQALRKMVKLWQKPWFLEQVCWRWVFTSPGQKANKKKTKKKTFFFLAVWIIFWRCFVFTAFWWLIEKSSFVLHCESFPWWRSRLKLEKARLQRLSGDLAPELILDLFSPLAGCPHAPWLNAVWHIFNSFTFFSPLVQLNICRSDWFLRRGVDSSFLFLAVFHK